MKIDILICVNKSDINYLFKYSLQSFLDNLPFIENIYVVTNDYEYMKIFLTENNFYSFNIFIIDEHDILPSYVSNFSGWYKQQIIKLSADNFCKSKYILCLGADVIIREELTINDFFYQKEPIIYFNRYKSTDKHLIYERERLLNITRILKTKPSLAYILGDFIFDAMIFKKEYLLQLRQYLTKLYGQNFWNKIIINQATNLEEKKYFGEWTMYALFVESILKIKPLKKNANNTFFYQIHSQSELDSFNFDSKIMHIVPKDINIDKFIKSFIFNNKSFRINPEHAYYDYIRNILNNEFSYKEFKNNIKLGHIDTQKLLIELIHEGAIVEKP